MPPPDPRKDRARDELARELVTTVYGRRDTEWALAAAIGRARRFIYIESPGFCSTSVDTNGNLLPDDLITALATRLAQTPELHLVVCTPRDTDFPKKFQIMANYEIQDRQVRFATLPDARAALFHPVGFPGRPSRLESTVVVVDDQWALVGSSTFRQRGLRFDGGSDLVFTDTVLENGVCPAIADFRRRVMANRLGLAPLDTGMPHPNYVRLFDGVEAFHVVKETLAVGGLGKIEPLWKLPDDAITPAPAKHANPNGVDVTADANLSLYVELFAQALITT